MNIVEFNGIKFYLDRAKRYYNGRVYYDGKPKKVGLHVYVWEQVNNARVPKGMHVHHIDGNCFNNAPENLEVINPSDHLKEHRRESATVDVACKHCGGKKRFKVFNIGEFCSNRCRQFFRRQRGDFLEERQCVTCGNSFKVDRYITTANCSRKCGLIWRNSKLKRHRPVRQAAS